MAAMADSSFKFHWFQPKFGLWPRKVKGGIMSLFDHCVNTIATAAILNIAYGGRVIVPFALFQHEQCKSPLLCIYCMTV